MNDKCNMCDSPLTSDICDFCGAAKENPVEKDVVEDNTIENDSVENDRVDDTIENDSAENEQENFEKGTPPTEDEKTQIDPENEDEQELESVKEEDIPETDLDKEEVIKTANLEQEKKSDGNASEIQSLRTDQPAKKKNSPILLIIIIILLVIIAVLWFLLSNNSNRNEIAENTSPTELLVDEEEITTEPDPAEDGFVENVNIIGTWEWEFDSDFIYTFNADGTAVRGFSDMRLDFNWEISNDNIIYKHFGLGVDALTERWIAAVDGEDVLTIVNLDNRDVWQYYRAAYEFDTTLLITDSPLVGAWDQGDGDLFLLIFGEADSVEFLEDGFVIISQNDESHTVNWRPGGAENTFSAAGAAFVFEIDNEMLTITDAAGDSWTFLSRTD